MKSSFLVRVETRDCSVEKEQPAGSPRTSIVPQPADEYNVKYGKISYQISGPALPSGSVFWPVKISPHRPRLASAIDRPAI